MHNVKKNIQYNRQVTRKGSLVCQVDLKLLVPHLPGMLLGAVEEHVPEGGVVAEEQLLDVDVRRLGGEQHHLSLCTLDVD